MCTCMQKINFIPPIVFEILKIKNPAIWLTESIFHLARVPEFSQTCGYDRIIKVMVHDLNPTWFTHQWIIFLQNPKNPYFGVFWGIIPKIQKSSSLRFLPLRHPNTSWEYWEKSYELFIYWHTDILTVVKS